LIFTVIASRDLGFDDPILLRYYSRYHPIVVATTVEQTAVVHTEIEGAVLGENDYRCICRIISLLQWQQESEDSTYGRIDLYLRDFERACCFCQTMMTSCRDWADSATIFDIVLMVDCPS
jgi:hypothetical protein